MQTYFKKKIFFHIQLFKNLAKNPKFWIVLCIDIVLLALANFLSYAVRFELDIPSFFLRQYFAVLPFIITVKIPFYYIFGLYRGMWRYTGLNDIINILTVSLFSSAFLITVLLFGNRFIGFSRSVFILDCFFSFAFISLHRISILYFYQKYNTSQGFLPQISVREKKRLLLIGAGDAAEKVLREFEENKELPYAPVGLLDDDHRKIGFKLHGIPVIGMPEDLTEHVRRTKAQEILIATVAADKLKMRRFIALCQQTNLAYKILAKM